MYYKFDDKKIQEIKELNKKISEEQKLIFNALLEISKSFSDDSITREERNKLFDKVDILKSNIKEYNKNLKDIIAKEDKNEDKKLNIAENNSNEEDVVNNDNEEIEQTITKLEDNLKELNKEIEDDTSSENISRRKKARNQLIVVEDERLSSKIKGFFAKLKSMIK